jgi:hypothetical protein
MKDSEIKELFKIPNSTFYDWKKRDDYRRNIIDFLKKLDRDEVLKTIKEPPIFFKGIKLEK